MLIVLETTANRVYYLRPIRQQGALQAVRQEQIL